MPNLPTWARGLLTVLLIGLAVLSWSRHLDDAAHAATLENFKRALAVAALARAFNGVISVAQGTEVAIQPVGVGVTLSVGEILDPLNDLVERFSMLALLASVSLGLQVTLGQILATPWLSGLLSAAIAVYIALLWRRPRDREPVAGSLASRCLGVLIFARFLLAVVLLTTHWLDSVFLSAMQDKAVAQLSATSESIEQLQAEAPALDPASEESFLDRTAAGLSALYNSSKQTLDLKAQLKRLETRVESSVEEIINLIVIFLLQTLLIPLGTLWLCWWALQGFWLASGRNRSPDTAPQA